MERASLKKVVEIEENLRELEKKKEKYSVTDTIVICLNFEYRMELKENPVELLETFNAVKKSIIRLIDRQIQNRKNELKKLGVEW